MGLSTEGGLSDKEILYILKEKYGFKLAESEEKSLSKFRNWVNRGYIEKPKAMVGITGTGGRQRLYSEDVPGRLARFRFLELFIKLPLKDLAKTGQITIYFKPEDTSEKNIFYDQANVVNKNHKRTTFLCCG